MAEVTAAVTVMAVDMALAEVTAADITLADITDIAADLRATRSDALTSDAGISAALASRHVTRTSARCATPRWRRDRLAMR